MEVLTRADLSMQRESWGLLIAGLAISLLLYAPAFDNPFRDDDYVFLHHVVTHASIRELLWPAQDVAFYRPAAMMLFRLESRFFGLHGGTYLLFNYFVHLANTALLFCVLRRAGIATGAAALAVALFAIGFGHYGKQVLWACTSGPLVSVTLGLAATFGTLRLADSLGHSGGARHRLGVVASVLAALAAAPLFHEASLILPALLAAILWLRGRGSHRDRVACATLFALPPLGWAIVLHAMSSRYPVYHGSSYQAREVPGYLFRYLGFMLVPVQDSQWSWAPRMQLVLAAAMVAASAALLRRGTWQTKLLVVWIYLALAPFGLVAMPGHWLEMRYVYAASMPLCALAGMLGATAWASRRTSIRILTGTALLALVIGCLGFELQLEHRYDRYSRQPANLARLRAVEQELQHPAAIGTRSILP